MESFETLKIENVDLGITSIEAEGDGITKGKEYREMLWKTNLK